MLTRIAVALTSVLIVTSSALAQKAYEVPKLNYEERSVMIEWGIGSIFLVGCLVVAFKPAKRSNLK